MTEIDYNNAITEKTLDRQEVLDPKELRLLTYSRPNDKCGDIESGRLGNMKGGYHFELFGVNWYGSEHLYLCGEWSTESERCVEIQRYIRKIPSGSWAKRCSKAKYKNEIRPDFTSFRHQWMLYCVWQKCLFNKDFANYLKSIPDNVIIVEEVKDDPIWAAYPDDNGIYYGANGMGKILTICRRCLIDGSEPKIDTDLLNDAGIYILGNRIVF